MSSSSQSLPSTAQPVGVVIEPREAGSPSPPARSAAIAASQLFAVSLLLGLLGLTSALFVITRLLESWRVTPGPASHRISIFGQQLSYPAANFGALVVVVLATIGLPMAGVAARGFARELLADRRFRRALSARSRRPLDGAWVVEDERPQAFCASLLRPRVYVDDRDG